MERRLEKKERGGAGYWPREQGIGRHGEGRAGRQRRRREASQAGSVTGRDSGCRQLPQLWGLPRLEEVCRSPTPPAFTHTPNTRGGKASEIPATETTAHDKDPWFPARPHCKEQNRTPQATPENPDFCLLAASFCSLDQRKSFLGQRGLRWVPIPRKTSDGLRWERNSRRSGREAGQGANPPQGVAPGANLPSVTECSIGGRGVHSQSGEAPPPRPFHSSDTGSLPRGQFGLSSQNSDLQETSIPGPSPTERPRHLHDFNVSHVKLWPPAPAAVSLAGGRQAREGQESSPRPLLPRQTGHPPFPSVPQEQANVPAPGFLDQTLTPRAGGRMRQGEGTADVSSQWKRTPQKIDRSGRAMEKKNTRRPPSTPAWSLL